MTQVKHALLSPSGAERWLACTPSAVLEQQFKDTAGRAADEGTLAHKLGELLIRQKMKLVSKADYNKQFNAIKADDLYEDNMLEHADNYAVYVMEQFTEAKMHTSDALLFLEQRLDLTAYIQEGFGTGDTVIIADRELKIIDLKYGKGVPVSAVNNKQMMLYALGALKDFYAIYDINQVSMTIYQPRLDTISTWEMSVPDLFTWAEQELKPRAALAFEGKGEYNPGLHCRFCKAKARCRANADFNLAIAQDDFKAPELLSDEEIVAIMNKSDMFKTWLKGVDDYTLNEAVNNGKQWPGYKVVEGKSNRVYTDEGKVVEVLIEKGFEKDKLYKPAEVIGITQMEKLIGKKNFPEYLKGLVIKPKGKLTLVPESDERLAYNSIESAQEDFAETAVNN